MEAETKVKNKKIGVQAFLPKLNTKFCLDLSKKVLDSLTIG